ncbi:transposase B [Burkholderia lata]|uniref:Transposase B n=1 Tax=Burkholderia lata (strain ATCC 17760 / DSM 23089 / LMG 22485 / NCIMB 9086 / R18194 / 383) TaxID=482957 RepID=A0A6P2RGB2_BURL3|nr:transposase B [Burkholderia lata]
MARSAGIPDSAGCSRRKTCCYLGLSRRVATYTLNQPRKDRRRGEQLISVAQEVPRFGYRRMSPWLALGESRVRRIWRALQLNIPRRRPRRRRCGSDIRLPGATQPNSVWSYDCVHDQLVEGWALKMLCMIDEYTCECFAIEVGASQRSQEVILTLSQLMRLYGKPVFVRPDKGANLPPPRSCAGYGMLQSVRPSSRRPVRGKTDSSRPSMASCATNC